MKKIISLVVMTAMLMTLFAVNASAAVFSGKIDLVPVVDFESTPTNNWLTGVKAHPSSASATGTIVSDAALGSNVLSLVLDGNGTTQGTFVGYRNTDGVVGDITFPQKYVISFCVKRAASKNASGFAVWIDDDDLGGGAYAGIAGNSLTTGVWYEYKIAIDKSASPVYSISRRDITNNGAWTAVTLGGGWNSGRWLQGHPMNSNAEGVKAEVGLFFMSYHDTAANDNFMFDNFSVNEPAPTTGVYYSKDFEEDSTLTVRHGMGTVGSGKEENGNTYGILNVGSDGKMNIIPTAENTIKGLTSKDCWILEFDLCAKTAGSAFTAQVSCEHDVGGSMYTLQNLPVDTWYTYRMTYDGSKVVGSPSGRFIERTVRGTNNWEFVGVFGAGAGASFTDGENSTATETIVFMNGNTNVSTFWIDNITLSALESSAYITNVDGSNLNVVFAHDKVDEMYRVADRAVALATFDSNGTLLAVDYNQVANNAGTVSTNLSASTAGASSAYIYVWDYTTARPIMTRALNLSSYIQ